METTLIRKVKRPSGATGLWAAYVLDEDEHGLWLFSSKGCVFRAEQDGQVLGVCEVGQGSRAAGVAVLHLVPRRDWGFAHLYGSHEPELFGWPASAMPAEPGRRAIAIDVSRPPVFVDGAWTYVDLEVDLLADAAGVVVVADEGEFEDRCAAGVISSREQVEARATTAAMEARLRACAEPFGVRAWERIDAAIDSGLPALPTVATRTLAGLEQRTASSGGNLYWVPIAAAWIGQCDDHDHRWRDIEWLDDEDTLRLWADVVTT